MDERLIEALVHQLSIQNRVNIYRELIKVGYLESEDYVKALLDICDEMR